MSYSAGLRLSIAVLAATLGLTACGTSRSGRSDKAGGTGAPVVLRLATPIDPAVPPERDWLAYFAAQTEKLSHGAVRIRLIFNAEGAFNANVNADEDVARGVVSGKYDMGWTASRTWDLLGVDSFRALQAPLLVSTDTLMRRVAQSPVAAESLKGLDKIGAVGLALVPNELRYVFGRRAYISPADYAGARVRVYPSRTEDAVFSALGAAPVHAGNDDAGKLIADGRIDMAEAGGFGPPLDVISDVVFYSKFNTLFASKRAFGRLTPAGRAALRSAAARTLALRLGQKSVSEQQFVSDVCRDKHTRVVQPTSAQFAALEQATAPVTAQLERDPQTASLISQIQKLKASMPSSPVAVPDGCSQHAIGAPIGAEIQATSSHALDGTYRYVLTKADARRSVNTPDSQHVDEYPQVVTVSMRAGKWRSGTSFGPYAVKGNHLTFAFGGNSGVLVFAFRHDSDGTLHLKQINQTNPGDTFVWTTEPWRRIGPAPAKIK